MLVQTRFDTTQSTRIAELNREKIVSVDRIGHVRPTSKKKKDQTNCSYKYNAQRDPSLYVYSVIDTPKHITRAVPTYVLHAYVHPLTWHRSHNIRPSGGSQLNEKSIKSKTASVLIILVSVFKHTCTVKKSKDMLV